MKNNQALILQGWTQKTTDHWYPWLKEELLKLNYDVFLPELPTMQTKNPNMWEQLDYIEDLISFTDITDVIGHSLGTLLAMRLAEKNKYRKMVLVAGFDFDDLTEGLKSFWQNKINHEKIIKNTEERFVVHSNNDPYVTEFNAREMAKRLEAEFILIPNGGHFMKDDGCVKLTELLEIIK